jgi:3-hydroxyacyl-CoA dehydrogenase/enoyl-CoA hydratase/carnithine racemase
VTATAMPPAEVVTKAVLRQVPLPTGEKIALITLDNGFDHTKPSSFGPEGLASLSAAIDEAAASDADAIAVTGKPFVFVVGADLMVIPSITDREQAYELGKRGHDTFRKLGEVDKPTFAFVNGAAMGGGLEIALHCKYRSVSYGAAPIAMPECFLGLVPGWGGTYLLPNLIGAENALKLIVENPANQNKMVNAGVVGKLGIADVLFPPVNFLENSLEWAGKVLRGEVKVDRPEPDRGEAWDAAVAKTAKMVKGRFHGAAPSYTRALDLVAAAKTATRDEGFAAEDEALADLIMSEELRAGIYSFNLTQRRAKRPVGAPDKKLAKPIGKVGIVGAGLMASQLALLFIRRLQVPVVLTDIDQPRVDKGVGYVISEIDGLLSKKRINSDKANHLKSLVSGSLTKAAFADADFVIEAVFEDMKVKQQVLAEVEAEVAPDAILATNTSSLSITEMASGLQNPQRVVGFHFFNPVAVMPLLEVIQAERTDETTLATAFVVGKTLGKSCVLSKDRPAFIVNRLLVRWMSEIWKSIDEGTPVEVADQAFAPLGLPMSPMMLLGLVGPAIALHSGETLAEAFPDRFSVSPNLRRIVEAGKPGVYSFASGKPEIDPEVAGLLQLGDTVRTGDEVRQRALEGLAQEIRLMLDEGVVAEVLDIDLSMIMGAGWPFHLGGISPYLDRVGVSEKVTGKRFLPPGVASVPA